MSPAHLRVNAYELGLDWRGERVGIGRVVIHIPSEDLKRKEVHHHINKAYKSMFKLGRERERENERERFFAM